MAADRVRRGLIVTGIPTVGWLVTLVIGTAQLLALALWITKARFHLAARRMIPFHLATVEFFQLVKQHLAPDGVAVVNAGKGPDGDDRLGVALAGTMRQVFPQVFVIDTAGFGNQIVVGVNKPVGNGALNFQQNFERMQVPVLRTVM